jgi:hypothetical protein
MKTRPEITPSSKWVPAQQVTWQTSCGSSQAGNGNWPRRLNGEDSITRRLTEWHNCAITLETHCLRSCQEILNKHQFTEIVQLKFLKKLPNPRFCTAFFGENLLEMIWHALSQS